GGRVAPSRARPLVTPNGCQPVRAGLFAKSSWTSIGKPGSQSGDRSADPQYFGRKSSFLLGDHRGTFPPPVEICHCVPLPGIRVRGTDGSFRNGKRRDTIEA